MLAASIVEYLRESFIMRLWTFQGIAIYEQLIKEGIAYCSKPSYSDEENFMYAYRWMSAQMRSRIGESPIKGLEYPMWAWYQYDSAKKRKPTKSPFNMGEGIIAFMELEIPDNQVLLSDFSNWHAVLNQGAIDDWKRIYREEDRLEEAVGHRLALQRYEKSHSCDHEWDDLREYSKKAPLPADELLHEHLHSPFTDLHHDHLVAGRRSDACCAFNSCG